MVGKKSQIFSLPFYTHHVQSDLGTLSQSQDCHKLSMNISGGSASFAGDRIDALIVVEIDTIECMVGESHNLLYLAGIGGIVEQADGIIINGSDPGIEIIHC